MRQLAGFFPATEYPDVLVGLGEPDDAAIFRLDDTRALINTTDFFTPIVDDPWSYGAIAAANAMSDIYAMGGEVLFALNIAGFPDGMDAGTIAQIFAGGAVKMREAGAAIAGGHTVNSPEPFYGLAVTGLIHPDQVMRKGGARPGDQLFLTKPLGAGIITTAAKRTGPGESVEDRQARQAQGKPDLDLRDLDATIVSMLRLNRVAARAARAANVRAATDITGFGLLGHASEMVRGNEAGVGFVIEAATVPVLSGAPRYVEAGYVARGATHNPRHFGEYIHFADSVAPPLRTVLWESETSGGLLLAVPAVEAHAFTRACAEHQQPVWRIGEVVRGEDIQVI